MQVAARSAWFLLGGLVVSLAAVVVMKIPASDIRELFMWYVAGIVGRDTAFMWGNRAEHAQPKKQESPNAL